MARRRKTVEELRLTGNYRPDRHAGRITASAQLEGIPVEPPASLTSAQKAIWRDQLDGLPAGFIPKAQQSVFEQWVRAQAVYHDASTIVDREGILVDGRDGGKVRNPALLVQHKALEQVLRLGGLLRLNDTEFIRRHIPEPTPIWIRQPKESA